MNQLMPIRKRSTAIRDVLDGELHDEELSREERTYFAALRRIEAMMLAGKTDRAIRIILRDQYGMKRRAANTAMHDTRSIFGDVRVVDRAWQRYRAEQMALHIYEQAAASSDLLMMERATKLYIAANGLNNEDPDLPEFENLQAAVNVLSLPAGMEEIALQLLQQGVVDMTRPPAIPGAPGTEASTEETTYVDLDVSA
jgi:hypothetical protein